MVYKYDFLIIGAGVAGMSYALKVARAKKGKVCMICKAGLDEANTSFAQGGVASVTNLKLDTFDKHIADTIIAGDFISDRQAVEQVVRMAPEQIKELTQWGVNFDRNEKGDFDFNDVVFDVEPNEAGTAAKITVLAAGGIYRLEVDGVEVHKALLGGDGQINENGFYPMINTGDGPQVDPAVIRTAYAGNFSTDENIRATIKNITVKVWKPQSNNSNDVVECTLSANRGEPASKVLVDKSFGIVPEHHSIADSYGNFTNYVQGEFQDDFWWK